MTLQETVGSNIRRHRQSLGLSQQALADRAGLSRRMITLIEAGNGNASLATLDRLAEALQSTFAKLTQAPPGASDRSDEATAIWQGKDERSKARLLESCAAQQQVELWSWSLAPGERYQAEPDRPGMRELILVIAGTLDLELGGAIHRLRAGQSINFASDQDYAYVNAAATMLRFVKNVVR